MNLPSIHSLRKAGFKVKIDHYRHVLFADDTHYNATYLPTILQSDPLQAIVFLHTLVITRKAKKERRFAYIHPKGGSTRLHLVSPDGKTEGFATADCSARDRFNRRLGLRICLSRLVSKGVIPAVLPASSPTPIFS